jgi:DNA topoisomerase-1
MRDANDAAEEAAVVAGLRYVHSNELPISRRRKVRGFSYWDRDGRPVGDERVLKRIQALAIPPAWRDVQIAERVDGHLQAIGRDQRGRRQYLYHPRFREVRDAAKFEHLIAFADGLPALRRRVARDMARRGLGRARVLATVVRLLETTMIRVGGAEYARTNHSFGVVSLRSRHVEVNGAKLTFHFTGKSGKEWRVGVSDRRLAGIVRACQELPGQALFQYVDDDGERRHVTSSDVNAYLKEASGRDISAKDFRTWWGTVLATLALAEQPASQNPDAARRVLKEVIAAVARQLGNTAAICLKCYVHPDVVAAHLEGQLQLGRPPKAATGRLAPEEQQVLTFLERIARRRDLRTAVEASDGARVNGQSRKRTQGGSAEVR